MEKTLYHHHHHPSSTNALFLLKPQNPSSSNALNTRPKLLALVPKKIPTLPDIQVLNQPRAFLTTFETTVQGEGGVAPVDSPEPMEVKEPSSLSLHELKRVEAQVTVLQAQVQQLESEKRLLELKVKQWETKEKKPTTCHEVETQTEEKEKEEEEEEEEEEGPILRHAMVQVCLDEPMSPGEYEDVDEGQVVDGSSSSSSSVISTPPCLHSKVDLQHVLLKCNDPRFSSKRPADLLGTSPRLSNPRLEKSHPPSPLPWVKKTTPPVPIPPFSTVSPPPTNLSSTEKLQAHATWLKGFLDVLEHTHLNFQHGMVRDDP